MRFEVLVLGCSSATPMFGRHPTAQLININEQLMLVDCGEGTQMQLSKFGIKQNKIKAIFISHLHGDHYLGLPGLLSSMHLMGRNRPLKLYGPPGLIDILELQFRYSETTLRYPLEFQATDPEKENRIYQDEIMSVSSFPLDHRIPCTGFRFEENRKLPVLRSYAYCSDTAATDRYLPFIAGVDLLYHEATFMHDMLDRAVETFHSTALQAGAVARESKVGKLIIGHYSARYRDLEPLLAEARTEFENTELAVEGRWYEVGESIKNS